MTYIPHSAQERDAMLAAIGVEKIDDLFDAIPAKYRFPAINIRPALVEMEAAALLGEIAASNESTRDLVSFLGAGVYNHYIPSVVNHVISRGEFYTAYTPYQPEISQGTLQAIFEYQSLICALTGMEVSNASHYDGATATAEAVNMAYANFRGKRRKIVISPTVHPQYRETIRTYTQGMELELAGDNSSVDMEAAPETLSALVDADTALLIVQYPDFFGRIFDYTRLISLLMRRELWSASWSTRQRWHFSRRRAPWERISSSGRANPWGFRCGLAGRILGFLPPKRPTSTRWRDA